MTFIQTGSGEPLNQSEQGGTHDLVDVANRHCSHCRVRVGFLEEQKEMTECKHRWLLTPVPDRNHYRYQCAKCNETAWATVKEKQS
jgi:hypothetical protein